jgi:hypothetical protein
VWMGSDGTNGQIFVAQTFVDTVPPTIQNVTATPNILWPPNHKMIPVVIQVSAADETDPAPVSHIVSVSCNEASAGAQDWVITGDLTLELRAERTGCNTDRIYTITVECEDESGNVSEAEATVIVPHDKAHCTHPGYKLSPFWKRAAHCKLIDRTHGKSHGSH